ncbi:MAG: hypothetical protein M0R34_02900 [Candidatus Marinimicrobia bacterium]|nr:hypothetical protein [Candidatus Neomarinimicrobiota bacterium]MCK9483292.1 hypothetical protein [Candidatus Neomarinimicrobiota bacterium]
MINKIVSKILIVSISLMVAGCTNLRESKPDLAVNFDGDAKIEVGGPYVGASFHHSCMIPQRISFFYPVANSIDHSHDYWTRDTSFVADWKLQIGDSPAIETGKEPAEFDLTPYAVSFYDNSENYSIKADYRFCHKKPAMVLSIRIVNNSTESQYFQFETQLRTSIRTCHTFRWIERADSEIEDNTIYTKFDAADADSAVVFVANAGELPVGCSSAAPDQPPYAGFIYKKKLQSGEALNIVQIIGSSKPKESKPLVEYLRKNYPAEIDRYEKFVNEQAFKKSVLKTGSPASDHSTAYARAVLASNAHYLDGEIVPMPCPAEYNFYFTHDVQVTDLAAVNYEPERVRRDLDYIIRHADQNHIIPHAYYWKDGKYVTEYASSDNWNNFWFVQVSAKYLRHSGDRAFLEKLYPFIAKSIERSLLTLEKDNLMWSYRPDWWDIGHNYGPRTYMTILAIKSLRDYIYISTVLNKNSELVEKYRKLADVMQTALVQKLWHEDLNFLVNYHNDGTLDEHYYIGSLLAAHYGFLDADKRDRLVKTATSRMVDPKVGIYNAFPMDFEKWGDFMQFVGNEAGAKYYYFNGGVWPQGNAWYALALIANDEKQAAAEFIAQTMSLHGIMKGPNGQPAYYEVRNANRENPAEYGSVDKPQFLWAGAWYLNCLYHLYGVRENDWNIALEPFLPKDQNACQFTLFVNGQPTLVDISGHGEIIQTLKYDGKLAHSAVFPIEMPPVKSVEIILGDSPKEPYLKTTDAILHQCQYRSRQLLLTLRGIPSLNNETAIISPQKPVQVTLNGQPLSEGWLTNKVVYGYLTRICFEMTGSDDKLIVQF